MKKSKIPDGPFHCSWRTLIKFNKKQAVQLMSSKYFAKIQGNNNKKKKSFWSYKKSQFTLSKVLSSYEKKNFFHILFSVNKFRR